MVYKISNFFFKKKEYVCINYMRKDVLVSWMKWKFVKVCHLHKRCNINWSNFGKFMGFFDNYMGFWIDSILRV